MTALRGWFLSRHWIAAWAWGCAARFSLGYGGAFSFLYDAQVLYFRGSDFVEEVLDVGAGLNLLEKIMGFFAFLVVGILQLRNIFENVFYLTQNIFMASFEGNNLFADFLVGEIVAYRIFMLEVLIWT